MIPSDNALSLGVHALVLNLPLKSLKVLCALILAVAIIAILPNNAIVGKQSEYVILFESKQYIKYGQSGEEVTQLQKLLNELSFYKSNVDGIFGDKTKVAVLEFQSKMNLGQDGIVGPTTKKALQAQHAKLNPPNTHTVAFGETLSAIASRYGLSTSTLIRINNLKNPDRIYPGDVLVLQAKEKVTDSKPEQPPTEPLPPPAEPLPVPNKRICLTFNDGPDPTTTPVILNTLDEYGIKAVFFVIGEKVKKHPELVRKMAEGGHVIGAHGYQHKVLAGLSAKQVYTDLQMAQACVAQVCGQKPYLYRPPYGILEETQIKEAQRLGMRVLMWTNIGGADLGTQSSQEVLERVMAGAKDGSIILLHEGFPHTAEALSEIIPSLARMGFGFQNLNPALVTESVPGQ